MYLVISLVVNQLKPTNQRKQLRQRKRLPLNERPPLKEQLPLKRPRLKLPQQHVEQKDQDHQKLKNQKNVCIEILWYTNSIIPSIREYDGLF